MAFLGKVLIEDKNTEDVLMAVMVIICVKSFEYIIKTLLTSSRNRTVKTGKFSLQVAADQVCTSRARARVCVCLCVCGDTPWTNDELEMQISAVHVDA